MRQGQQNRRGRGRNNNSNRKSQNPLMRSFESSGPDVKIRGTPSHIAEKYITLARDILSSGDPVLAENYLQHAEHYNRIILGCREQMAQQGSVDPMCSDAARTHSLAGSDGDELDDKDSDGFGCQPQAVEQDGQLDLSQRSFFQRQPRNFDNQRRYDDCSSRHERYNNNRHDRGDLGDRQDFRGDRNDRFEQRNDFSGEDRCRDDRRSSHNGNGEVCQSDGGFRRRERYQGQGRGNSNGNGGAGHEHANSGFQPLITAVLPSAVERERPAAQAAAPAAPVAPQEQPTFLRRPVHRPRREGSAVPPAANAANEDSE